MIETSDSSNGEPPTTAKRSWAARHKKPIATGTAALAIAAAYFGTRPQNISPLATPNSGASSLVTPLRNNGAVRFREVEIGDAESAVDQEKLNAQYLQIFNSIRDAKEEADRSGKPLSIIVAESHYNLDSFLAELMIIDAADKLGIKTLGMELDAKTIKSVETTADLVKQIRNQTLTPQYPTIASADEYTEDSFSAKRLARRVVDMSVIADVNNVWIDAVAEKTGKARDEAGFIYDIIHAQSRLRGMSVKSFDPLHLYAKEIRNVVREEAMVEAVRAEKTSHVGIFGAFHAPELTRQIRNNGGHALLINVLNQSIEIADRPNTTLKDIEDAKAKATVLRLDDLNNMQDLRIVIDGKTIPTVKSAIAHCLIASANHLSSIGLMDKDSYEQLAKSLKKDALDKGEQTKSSSGRGK